MIAADTGVPGWTLLATTLLGGLIALLGSWLTTWYQSREQHRARVEARRDYRRERRDKHLEDLTEAVAELERREIQSAIARVGQVGVSLEDRLALIAAGARVRSRLALIGDDPLGSTGFDWMGAMDDYWTHGNGDGDRAIDLHERMNRRIGELLRED